MNIDLRKVIFMWLALLISAVLIFLISACSPEYHKQKYFKKGGQFTCDIDTLKIIDSVIVDGATVYKVRDSLVVRTETKVIPKWLVRFDNKRFDDSLKHIRTMYIKELNKLIKVDNNDVKEKRIEARISKGWSWWQKTLFGIGFTLLGVIIALIYSFIRGLFKMPLNTFDR